MNNNKIIFGIIIFCAISFLAYTFANPFEDDEDNFIKDNQVNGTKVNNTTDNKKDEDEIKKPVKVEEVKKEDNNSNSTVNYPTYRPTTPSDPTPEPEPVLPKYTSITTNSNSGVNVAQNGSNISLTGEVPEIGTSGQGSVQISLTSPETYSLETLNNLQIIIEDSTLGTTITKTINDLPNMNTGNGTSPAVITVDYRIFKPRTVYLTIYWGTGDKIKYTITDNVTVKLNEIIPDPVIPDPEPEVPDPQPENPETPEVTD